jgi:hypothetical protein
MDHRIRVAPGMATPDKFTGHVEADETFIGQKAGNMHATVRAVKVTGTGGKDKTAAMGILEQSKDGKLSRIRTTVIPSRKNGLENFWSLLKRGISGTHVSVELFHLFRYLDEQSFRFNNRKMTDGARFSMAVSGVVGKRLTFDQLTGKTEAQA